MSDSIRELIVTISMCYISFYFGFGWHKEIKIKKQLQSENDNLIEQIKQLTHENNILKNQSADTK